MKKQTLLILGLIAALGLAGCGSSTANQSASESESETNAPSGTEETQKGNSETEDEKPSDAQTSAKTIQPMASDIDLNNLTNAEVHVSFVLPDDYKFDQGESSLTVTVYDYEKFDMVDIAQLQAGDKVVISGEEVPVKSVAAGDDGAVEINNGSEGSLSYSFQSTDSGFYYVSSDYDMMDYIEVGQTSFPLSDRLVFTDNFDPQNQGQTYGLSEFADLGKADDVMFRETTCTARIEDGEIVEITREYQP